MPRIHWLFVAQLIITAAASAESPQTLESRLLHLRMGVQHEWDEFNHPPDATALELEFSSPSNDSEWTLQLRQQDVKQAWSVTWNGQRVGALERDENDMLVYLPLPAGAVQEGKNALRISQDGSGKQPVDDIRVGEILLHPVTRQQLLQEATVEIEVVDEASGQALPSRITIVNPQFAMQTVGAASDDHTAVRVGTVYTADGKARFGLPAGSYTVYAGRGFEYSLAEQKLSLTDGQTSRHKLSLRREVPTDGYVACDTHVHTLTHSGHGDATVQERMITLAAEGIELPIATDHNVHVDHGPFAREMHVRQFFTPLIGNEVTTPSGHFNIFPVQAGAAIPDYKQRDWQATLDGIFKTPGVKVAILNHARDLHGGVRPFDPKLFNAAVGENLDGWAMRFNAMEIVNSSATQTDIMRLPRDWMALLNRGYMVTPVGSSDSHDVARHFVGQGRTYIRGDDRDPGAIDVAVAVDNFLQGRVNVSYGLLTELTVNDKFGSGELATDLPDEIEIHVRVLGPHWVSAQEVTLFANGYPLKQVEIPPSSEAAHDGVKWQGKWNLPKPDHDIYLVAVALGPGIDEPYWRTAKAYQPKSTQWEPRVIGVSGATWLDGDGDGQRSAAYDYAKRACTRSGNDFTQLVASLSTYDRAIAAQAAHLYQSTGPSLLDDDAQDVLRSAPEPVRLGFQDYVDAWRESQAARAQP